MMELGPRKQTLLQAIIEVCVRSADPVGSEWLAANQKLGVRSATIRNEMAELTELGLLRQPHTSAGRVPSDRGYRYYVDRLMHRRPLPAPQTRPLRELGRVCDGDVDDLLRQTCRALSSLTRFTSVASPPIAEHPRIRQVHLAKMSDRQLLVVVVLANGCLIHRFAEPPQRLSPGKVEPLIRLLEARKIAFETLQEMLAGVAWTVVIGSENPRREFQECSLVAARYGAGRSAAGWIGVVGPTRMPYGDTVPAVEMAA